VEDLHAHATGADPVSKLIPATHLHGTELRVVVWRPLHEVLAELQEVIEEEPCQPSGNGDPVVFLLLGEERTLEVLASIPELVQKSDHTVTVVGPVGGTAVNGIKALPGDVVVEPREDPLPVLPDLVVYADIRGRQVAVPC
jgi:hypothetical protein